MLLLVLDTQRADRLSCYGNLAPTSPGLDAFVEDATLYRFAVAPAQWTVPTHTSMFTGHYPTEHTVYHMHSVLPRGIKTLAERLAAAGYLTVGFSQNPLVGLVNNELTRGFHRFRSFNLLSNVLLTTRLNRPENKRRGVAAVRHAIRQLLAESLGYSQETALHHLAPIMRPIWKGYEHVRRESKSHSTENLLGAALQLFTERQGTDSSQPIFAFINLMGAHVPYAPPEWALRQFVDPVCGVGNREKVLLWANRLQVDVVNWLAAPRTEEETLLLRAIYDAEVAAQDRQVGGFLDTLRAQGHLDNTLVAIVADHGDHLGERQRVNHGFGVHNVLVHVPLIVRASDPSFQAGSSVDAVVSTRRLFHTFLTGAGAATAAEERLALTADNAAGGQGVLDGDTRVFSEGYPLEWALRRFQGERAAIARIEGHDRPVRAVFDEHYKFIIGSGSEELFDYRADPAETNDLHEQYPEQAVMSRHELERFIANSTPVTRAELRTDALAPELLEQLRDLGYME